MNNNIEQKITGNLNGHDYVDLGLPSGTLWATCNLGAGNPKKGGYYFAWGETSPKRNYEYDNYRHYNGDGRQITKYCTKSNYGNNCIVDNLTNLLTIDDAAAINWGTGWKMPTKSEMIELYEECIWEWEDGGYIINGPNGNTIFLPAAGGEYENDYYPTGVYGGYWSNSLDTDRPDGAFGVFFGMYRINLTYGDRIMGSSVRPVCKSSEIEKNNKSAITSLQSKGLFEESDSKTAPKVISGTTKKSISGILNGHEWIDLGLPSGIHWVSCNIGAAKPEDYGAYYAWGERTPKHIYNSSTYTFSSKQTNLPRNADAATVNWGNGWRMPTYNDFKELENNCAWIWSERNGVNGFKVVGPNGNSIFLPAAGNHYNGEFCDGGSCGFYWSSSLYPDNSNYAWYLIISSDNRGMGNYYCFYGRSVRAVCQ